MELNKHTYGFDKAKLPKGYFFPLKRSFLDNLILEYDIKKIHVVYYWLAKLNYLDPPLLRADYTGESKKERFAAGKSSITVYGVKSSDKDDQIKLAANEGTEAIMKWINMLENSGNVVRAKDHSIIIYWKNGKLTVENN